MKLFGWPDTVAIIVEFIQFFVVFFSKEQIDLLLQNSLLAVIQLLVIADL